MSDMQTRSGLRLQLFGGSRSRQVIFGAVVAIVAFVMEVTLVPLLLPTMQAELNLTVAEVSWLFNSYGFAVACGVLLGGWLGDAKDTRIVFCGGILFFATGSVLVASLGTYELILLGRTLQGLGGGIFTPAIPILLTRASPRRPGKTLIIAGSVAGYVSAFAPFLYGLALDEQSWRFAFLVFGLVSVIGLFFVLCSDARFGRPYATAGLPNYLTLLKVGELRWLFIYVFCTYGAITYFIFKLPLWLSETNTEVATIGMSLSFLWLSFSMMSTVLRNLVDKSYVRSILLAAPFLIASALPLAYYCEELWCLLTASVLMGFGLACSNAPSTQMILYFAPPELRTASASLDITCARLGGVFLVGLFAETTVGFSALTLTAFSLVAFLSALAVVARYPDR